MCLCVCVFVWHTKIHNPHSSKRETTNYKAWVQNLLCVFETMKLFFSAAALNYLICVCVCGCLGVCNPLAYFYTHIFVCVQLVYLYWLFWRGVSIFAQHCNFKKAHSESIYIQQNVHKNLSHTPYPQGHPTAHSHHMLFSHSMRLKS